MRPAAPAEAVSIETANAARGPPKVSSGSEYMLTLKAATAKKLREIPQAARPTVGVKGMAKVMSERMEAARQTERRASAGSTPDWIQRRESQPPSKPPRAARAGGIQAYRAAWTRVRRRASTK